MKFCLGHFCPQISLFFKVERFENKGRNISAFVLSFSEIQGHSRSIGLQFLCMPKTIFIQSLYLLLNRNQLKPGWPREIQVHARWINGSFWWKGYFNPEIASRTENLHSTTLTREFWDFFWGGGNYDFHFEVFWLELAISIRMIN